MAKGKGGGKQTTSSEPWKESIPYLLGKDGQPGVLPEAARLYTEREYGPEQEQLTELFKGLFPERYAGTQAITSAAGQIGNGAFDTIVNPAQKVKAGQVNAVAARKGQGTLDPTAALQQQLTGQVNNAVLDPQARNIVTQITRNTRENVLPLVRQESIANGQYGGSSQGIAEGLAASRLNADLATGLAPLYGQAYENAQNRQMTVADRLNQQAVDIMTGNVNRDFEAQRFNSGMGLQQGQLQLAANQANVNNRINATNLYGQGLNFQDQGFGQFSDLLNAENNYQTRALEQFANFIMPGAGLGGTTTQKMQNPRSPIASAAGGAMAGLSTGNPIAAAAGGVLGLIGGLL